MICRCVCLSLGIAFLMASCGSAQDEHGWRALPIINGTQVFGDDHLSTVGVVQKLNENDYRVLCTGTLISPDHVLTAAHCVTGCADGSEPVEELRPVLRIGIGQSVGTFRYVAEIIDYYVHPDYACDVSRIDHDIAVLRLRENVPESIVLPTPYMSKASDISSDEVDTEDGVVVTRIGYGRTKADDPLSQGKKFKTQGRIHARCPTDAAMSARCGEKYTKDKGFLYFEASNEGTCQGDSGGPVLLTKGGQAFVIGVTSYGYDDCKYMDVASIVSEYEGFISKYVPAVDVLPKEDCGNGRDDDGDGAIDCADGDCASSGLCAKEDCGNGRDDCEDRTGEQTMPTENKGSSSGCSVAGRPDSLWGWMWLCAGFAAIWRRWRKVG